MLKMTVVVSSEIKLEESAYVRARRASKNSKITNPSHRYLKTTTLDIAV